MIRTIELLGGVGFSSFSSEQDHVRLEQVERTPSQALEHAGLRLFGLVEKGMESHGEDGAVNLAAGYSVVLPLKIEHPYMGAKRELEISIHSPAGSSFRYDHVYCVGVFVPDDNKFPPHVEVLLSSSNPSNGFRVDSRGTDGKPIPVNQHQVNEIINLLEELSDKIEAEQKGVVRSIVRLFRKYLGGPILEE